MQLQERIAHGYFFAKKYVISKGFANELDWQEQLNLESITEQKLLNEFCWVILSSGMRENVIKKIYPLIKSIMFDFSSAELITKKKKNCLNKALKFFNHKGKIGAIIYAAEYLHNNSFEFFKYNLQRDGISFLKTFPFIGEATSFHLAKNIGYDVAKPDRHLIKISSALGFISPAHLCKEISARIDEKVSLIDLVLWRYATLDKEYLKRINWFFGNINVPKS
ncbi:MAG: hypothetical protein ABI550_00530 [Ignavibacteriaceae bacterium]